MKTVLRCSVVFALCVSRAEGDHDAGIRALQAGDYDTASRELQAQEVRRLATTGDASAQYCLGRMYRMGIGVNRDFGEAALWYRKAADQQMARAEAELGVMYVEGTFLRRDLTEGKRWIRRGAEHGSPFEAFMLALSYRYGGNWLRVDWPIDNAQAAEWYRVAADGGEARAYKPLGELYEKGEGTKKDQAEAVKWFRKAAEYFRNDAYSNDGSRDTYLARWNLGSLYQSGLGVPQDFVQAYMWFNLATLADDNDIAGFARKDRDGLAVLMTREQIAEAQKLAREWKSTPPLITTQDATQGDTPPHLTEKEGAVDDEPVGEGGPAQTGTGFVVNRGGYLVTNHHVIAGCRTVTTELDKENRQATIVAVDQGNDLALIRIASASTPSVASFRGEKPVRPGQSAIAVGYPLYGLLSSNPSITVGNVSALAGINDDIRYLQFTAPVQPGNSGGPLLDEGGNVIGIVESKLDAVNIAKATGDIPQNVNFAIKANVVRTFLDAHGVHYSVAAAAQQSSKLDAAQIGERSSRFTVLVECLK